MTTLTLNLNIEANTEVTLNININKDGKAVINQEVETQTPYNLSDIETTAVEVQEVQEVEVVEAKEVEAKEVDPKVVLLNKLNNELNNELNPVLDEYGLIRVKQGNKEATIDTGKELFLKDGDKTEFTPMVDIVTQLKVFFEHGLKDKEETEETEEFDFTPDGDKIYNILKDEFSFEVEEYANGNKSYYIRDKKKDILLINGTAIVFITAEKHIRIAKELDNGKSLEDLSQEVRDFLATV
jgi:hypothetical protein